ncbi:hypothetical protein [Aridibaculum aurantiacum]|uniref:hypothetical protein n=1 Tax=Aridibaculum aurantiacum TaxID=2810307 RepID=UPI001A958F63|nr:hypothetical protein [Aridibaculum aurantiacum]
MQTVLRKSAPLAFISKFFMALMAILVSVVTFAQDGGGGGGQLDVNVNTNSGGGGFFGSPWVWVVGIAVFILLLVALLRGGSRREV